MTSDSGLFRTRDDLEGQGYALDGNRFVKGKDTFLPLYEAKMIHQYDHRFATYTSDGSTRDVTDSEHADPTYEPLPRYWVEKAEVDRKLEKRDKSGKLEWTWDEKWLLGFRGRRPNYGCPYGDLLAPPADGGRQTTCPLFPDRCGPSSKMLLFLSNLNDQLRVRLRGAASRPVARISTSSSSSSCRCPHQVILTTGSAPSSCLAPENSWQRTARLRRP